jgi:hypothetical protein
MIAPFKSCSGHVGFHNWLTRLLNRPERKRLSFSKAGILMIEKIKPTIAIRSEMRLIFTETESIECARVCFGTNLNDYEILIAQPVNNKDFCGKSCHWRPFLSLSFTLRLEKPIPPPPPNSARRTMMTIIVALSPS